MIILLLYNTCVLHAGGQDSFEKQTWHLGHTGSEVCVQTRPRW